MTRRLQVWVLMLGVTLGVARLSAHDELTFTGTVVRMDVTKNVLTFKTREEDKDLTLKVKFTAKTQVERDGKRTTRAALKPGMAVVVHALGCGYDDMDAVKVQIAAPPAR
jgi:hypothetical protein